MAFVRARRAEQCHDPIAESTHNGAIKAPNRIAHSFKRRLDTPHCRLRIQERNKFRRAY
jgi:hypothetical protein